MISSSVFSLNTATALAGNFSIWLGSTFLLEIGEKLIPIRSLAQPLIC